jgi:hypothetical protein
MTDETVFPLNIRHRNLIVTACSTQSQAIKASSSTLKDYEDRAVTLLESGDRSAKIAGEPHCWI